MSLYLIDGERVVPRCLRDAVVKLDQRFLDEDSQRVLPGELHFSGQWAEGDEVWLWLDPETGRELGYAAFPLIRGRGRVLQRVWIEPAYRRRGLLAEAWDVWCERYGEGFAIEEPNVAMRAFLESRREGGAR